MDLPRSHKTMLLILVYIALCEDMMLTCCVVSIVPDYLFRLWHPNFTATTLAALKGDVNGNYSEAELLAVVDEERKAILNDENIAISMLFSVKCLVQIFANIAVGVLCDRIGFSAPLFTGFVVTFLSSLAFAFNDSYEMMFVARAFTGLGSACASTAGLGLLAASHENDEERGHAVGRALGGMGLGILLGPAFGGFFYSLWNIKLPFLILAALALLVVQLSFLPPKIGKVEVNTGDETRKVSKISHLLCDPYILIVTGSMTLTNMCVSLIEPSLPLYMMQRWKTDAVTQGVIFLPLSGLYLLSTQVDRILFLSSIKFLATENKRQGTLLNIHILLFEVTGPLANRVGRWLVTIVGHGLAGTAFICMPLMPEPVWLIVPMAMVGLSMGMSSACNFAELPRIVDRRHSRNLYGSVYAIASAAPSIAFFFGPFIGGPLIAALDFQIVLAISAAVVVLYAPLLLANRNIKRRDTAEAGECKYGDVDRCSSSDDSSANLLANKCDNYETFSEKVG